MLAYEGLTAFALEAGFLGVLLFGRDLVPRWAHFAAALLVATGTLLSTFWILVTNSWMQTPAGYRIVNGIFYPTSWTAIIFNPSFPYRFAHTVAAFYVTTGFAVLGVAAYLLRRNKSPDEARRMLSITLWLLTILVPLQIFLGDQQGLNTLQYQPAKLAAIEAHWPHEARAPLTLFAIPDQQAETNHYAVEVPLLGSLILTHDVNGVVPGLKDFPPANRATVIIPFFAFRIMVGIGFAMLGIVLAGLWLRWRRKLYDHALFLKALMLASPLGFLAVIAGWTTTEAGRQPWTVYNVMRTAQSVTPSLSGSDVLLSLLGYMAVYCILFPTALWLVARIVRDGVKAHGVSPVAAGRPASPVKPVPDAAP
jgi:cytochrome d ubiquinol oxidase subunit I